MMYKAEISYAYTVAEVPYTSEMTKRFPVGLTTEVYYNPEAPSEAVLQRGVPTFLYYIYWSGFVFAVVGRFLMFSFLYILMWHS